ncbi:hypothetical protein COY06_00675 [Candidatus Peregrinibacteria bacterium CG_4_10_14_0_2_um_filter_41_8]|nr:MAG: hypothetical protein COY06_00675 [Candidatus Peregrinibacteria bacterium CG_4_10_14_0_2_um_filter_41_8]
MDQTLHPTLQKQIKKHLGLTDISKLDQNIQNFIYAINKSYSTCETETHISTKIKAYQRQIKENERLTKVMIGRELKMLELKKENETLNNQLSNLKNNEKA